MWSANDGRIEQHAADVNDENVLKTIPSVVFGRCTEAPNGRTSPLKLVHCKLLQNYYYYYTLYTKHK